MFILFNGPLIAYHMRCKKEAVKIVNVQKNQHNNDDLCYGKLFTDGMWFNANDNICYFPKSQILRSSPHSKKWWMVDSR